MRKFFGKTKIDFLGKRHLAITFSALAILIGIISLVIHGGPNYSIDFSGGLSILIRVNEPEGEVPLDEEMVRATLTNIELGNSEVKMSRSPEGEDLMIKVKEEARFKPPETLIRNALDAVIPDQWRMVPDERLNPVGMPDLEGRSFVGIITDAEEPMLQTVLDSSAVDDARIDSHTTTYDEDVWLLSGVGQDVSSRVLRALAGSYPDYQMDVRSIDRVGPRIGAEMRIQALLAIIAALGLIIIYLWWRFEFLFGIAAVAALFHDVLITLGIFSILNLEISITVIGAFLTLVGYSLNDTIVVFDRIRENLKRFKEAKYDMVINRSINDNLSRTIITSLTTFVVVLVLFFNGGEVLHSFALALLVGIIVGTYSSIYIASPILVEWAERTGATAGKKKARR